MWHLIHGTLRGTIYICTVTSFFKKNTLYGLISDKCQYQYHDSAYKLFNSVINGCVYVITRKTCYYHL